jgi:hypothetical protein
MKSIIETVCGLLIISAAAAAGHFWHVNAFLVVLGALIGLSLLNHICQHEN